MYSRLHLLKYKCGLTLTSLSISMSMESLPFQSLLSSQSIQVIPTLEESELFMYGSAPCVMLPWRTFSILATRNISG